MMRSRTDVATAMSAGTGFKLAAMALAGLIGLMLTLVAAEASGDPYADAYDSTGQVDGALANVAGPADGTIVQVGANEAGGALIVAFVDNVAYNGPGADITIHTLDTEDPATALIELSNDGVSWISAGQFSDGAGDIHLDLADLGLSFATAARITYVSGPYPGFDVDAVEALNQVDLEDVTITVAPTSDTGFGFGEHVVTATVVTPLGGGDVPVAGVLVSFAVTSGPSTGTAGTATTSAAGVASFGWTGTSSGLDEVAAWLDVDASGTPDEGEIAGEATKLWSGDTGTIALIDVDGDALAVDDLVQVVVDDLDLDGTDAVDTIFVPVTSTSDPAGILLILTETGAHTGLFVGVLELSDASNQASRQLRAAVTDLIIGTYDDALDASGADPTPVNATLAVTVKQDDPELDADELVDEQHATVCHIPGGDLAKRRTLTVGADALDAHLGHGDVEGDCSDVEAPEDLPSKQEQAEQRKADRDDAFCERKGNSHPRCSSD